MSESQPANEWYKNNIQQLLDMLQKLSSGAELSKNEIEQLKGESEYWKGEADRWKGEAERWKGEAERYYMAGNKEYQERQRMCGEAEIISNYELHALEEREKREAMIYKKMIPHPLDIALDDPEVIKETKARYIKTNKEGSTGEAKLAIQNRLEELMELTSASNKAQLKYIAAAKKWRTSYIKMFVLKPQCEADKVNSAIVDQVKNETNDYKLKEIMRKDEEKQKMQQVKQLAAQKQVIPFNLQELSSASASSSNPLNTDKFIEITGDISSNLIDYNGATFKSLTYNG